jgi:hypothetical protein
VLAHDVVRPVALDDPLQFLDLVAGDDGELPRVRAKPLVLGSRHANALRAIGPAALADELELLVADRKRFGDSADALVDLAEDRLIETDTTFLLVHGAHRT